MKKFFILIILFRGGEKPKHSKIYLLITQINKILNFKQIILQVYNYNIIKLKIIYREEVD